jgi:hypothetical protein
MLAALALNESGGKSRPLNSPIRYSDTNRLGMIGKYQQHPKYWSSRAVAAGLPANANPWSPTNQERVSRVMVSKLLAKHGGNPALVAYEWRSGAANVYAPSRWTPGARSYVAHALGNIQWLTATAAGAAFLRGGPLPPGSGGPVAVPVENVNLIAYPCLPGPDAAGNMPSVIPFSAYLSVAPSAPFDTALVERMAARVRNEVSGDGGRALIAETMIAFYRSLTGKGYTASQIGMCVYGTDYQNPTDIAGQINAAIGGLVNGITYVAGHGLLLAGLIALVLMGVWMTFKEASA